MKPAAENRARWFSQLGSLIQTFARGEMTLMQFRAELQRARSAERLHGGDIGEIAGLRENHLRDGGVVGAVAVDGHIGVWAGLGEQRLFRLLHASQQGDLAVSRPGRRRRRD